MEQWELRKSRLHTDSSQGPTVIWTYDVILPILCFFLFCYWYCNLDYCSHRPSPSRTCWCLPWPPCPRGPPPTEPETQMSNAKWNVKCNVQQCFCTLTTLPAKVSPTARLALLSTHCLLWIKQRWFGQGLHHHHHHNQGHRGWFFGCYHPHHHCPAQVCNIAVISTCKMQQRANGKVRN